MKNNQWWGDGKLDEEPECSYIGIEDWCFHYKAWCIWDDNRCKVYSTQKFTDKKLIAK